MLVDVLEKAPRVAVVRVGQHAREHHLRVSIRGPDRAVRDLQQPRVNARIRWVHRTLQVGLVPDLPRLDRLCALTGMLRLVLVLPEPPIGAVTSDRSTKEGLPGIPCLPCVDRWDDRAALPPF